LRKQSGKGTPLGECGVCRNRFVCACRHCCIFLRKGRQVKFRSVKFRSVGLPLQEAPYSQRHCKADP
jgi:hypothetical protein